MNVPRPSGIVENIRSGKSRRGLLKGLAGGSIASVLALFGSRTNTVHAQQVDPTVGFIVPGTGYQLELSAKGAGCDIRSWVNGEVGRVGGPLFLNNNGNDNKTIINAGQGNVGIGTTAPTAKLHVNGDLRVEGKIAMAGNLAVDGELIGATRMVSQHPTDPDLEIAHASLGGGEVGTYARGSGKLVAGEAIVNLPAHFGLVSRPEGLTVQLTARGQRLELFVTDLTPERLVVQEASGRDGDFDFLVQGMRVDAGEYAPIRAKSVIRGNSD